MQAQKLGQTPSAGRDLKADRKQNHQKNLCHKTKRRFNHSNAEKVVCEVYT